MERRRRGRPQHVAPVNRGAVDIAAPRWLRRQILVRGNALLPRLAPLVAVVVAIALGDLAFLMLRLTRSAPPLRRHLILVEDRLLRERRLRQNKVGAFQLQQQECTEVKPEKIFPRQKANQTCREDRQLTNFSVPALGSIGSIRDGGHK
jgi:hypothetical protein